MSFSAKKIFFNNCNLIPHVVDEVSLQFQTDGYTVKKDALSSGEATIDISKGGVVSALFGLKHTLTIRIRPEGNNISVKVGTGMLGLHLVPTVLSIFFILFTIPFFLIQLYGLYKQSKLTTHTLQLIEESLMRHCSTNTNGINLVQGDNGSDSENTCFCPECGQPASGKFCPNCGAKLDQ